MAAQDITEPLMLDKTAQQLIKALEHISTSVSIIDNLITNDSTKALSAKQGKLLNDIKTNISDIIDDLSHTDTDKPLSAKQGKVLNDSKANKSEMSVVDGTGSSADKTTITLKTGTSATVLKSHQSLSDYVKGPSSSTDAHIATFNGTDGKTLKDSGFTIGKSVPSDAVFTDTTYESKSASSGGTDVSLVTTGEKYIWDNKGTYSKPSGGIPSTDLDSAVQTSLGKADSAYQKPSGGIPDTDLTSAVQTLLGKADTSYHKPSGGIPSTDMTSSVQTSLGKADTAYQKPSTGIPSTDMASSVQTSLGKANSSLQSTDIYNALDSTATNKALSANMGKSLNDSITTINGKIPSQASSSNQLADKNFVNSSIGTNTANYISNNGNPFTSLAQLQAYTGTVTNNDYAFVTGTDEAGNTYYDRYKATVSGSSVSWGKEYRLNNSSFTAAQWAAISSGITSTQVTSYSSHVSNNDIHVTTSDKSTWSGKYSKPSTGIPKTDLASAVQTSLDKADTALQSHQSLAAYVQGPASSTDAHVATFNGTGGKTIKDSGYTIAKSVPSDAVFTDTDTKVTSAGNHYTPSYSSTKSASGATGTSGTTVQVVTGVQIDSKGHVTGVTSGAATDTTYESKSASSGGTAVSLVTTGEKYTWNNKGTYSKPSGGIPASDLASSVIYNGLDKTTAGSALDATQGKVLNDAITAISNTSGVAEQGTGYIRYNNGLQICWDVITSVGSTYTYEPWGGGRIHIETFSPVKPFPKSFVANPSLTCTREHSGTAVLFIGIEFTESGISKLRFWRPDTEYYGFGYLDYIAIGRWK